MATRTTLRQRQEFYERHQAGETYQEMAQQDHVSLWTVRSWCRRQRDGGDCHTRYRREPSGLLSRFDDQVGVALLRLRQEHPRWGPSRILAGLRREPSLQGLKLPSPASIGRYLHQWPCFRRPPKQRIPSERPQAATRVHQRGQVDFKTGIPLQDGTLVNLHTVRDPVGAGSIGAFVFPAGQVGQAPRRVSWEQVRQGLRTCFVRWGTVPEEVQTDREAVLMGHTPDPFPSLFPLWLQGLGIQRRWIRPHTPTDNAEVERCHRTLYEYAIQGNEGASVEQLQAILDRSVTELNTELPSRAHGCEGKPPILAHPELLHPLAPSKRSTNWPFST